MSLLTGLELTLQNEYRNALLGLGYINNVSSINTLLAGSVNITSNLYVSNNTVFENYTSINSNLFISNNSVLKSNVSINSYFSCNTISLQNISINSNLNISGKTLINGNISVLSNFSGTGNLYSNTLQVNSNLNVQSLTLNQTTILSNLNVLGNANIININPINILYITGQTILQNSSIYSSLNISSTGILGNVTLNNSLNISSNSILTSVSINSLLTLSNYLIINNNLSINSNLSINTNSVFNSSISTGSLICYNNSIFFKNSTINSDLLVSGATIIKQNITNLSNLNISGYAILNQNTNLLSLNVSSSAIINNNMNINNIVTLNSNLTVSGNTTLLNLNVSANSITLNQLSEYFSNQDAANAGIPLWGYYRTGCILKIRTDTVAPIIKLNGASSITLYVGQTYTDLGASATDYLDKTANIITSGTVNTLVAGIYIITYTAIDSYNNQSSIQRTVNIILDNIIPSIQLNGLSVIKLTIGSNYIEQGITSVDYLGNNLIPVITGNVNTSQVGKYLITYTVTDKSGNINSLIRTIYILNISSIIGYQMNNPNTYLNISNNYNILSTSQYWTIESWVYLTSYSNTQCYDFIDFRNLPNTTSDGQFVLVISNRGILGYWYGTTNSFNYCPGSKNIPLNSWTHIVYQRNGIFLEFYINGTFAGNLTLGTTFDSPNIYNLNQITLGHSVDQSLSINNFHLQGSISQVKISIGKKYNISFYPNNDLSYDLSNTLFFLSNDYYDSITNIQMNYPTNLAPQIFNRQYFINVPNTNIESKNLLFNLQVSNLPLTNTTWNDTTGNYGFIVHPNANNYNSITITQNGNGWKRNGNIGWTLNNSSYTKFKNQNWNNGYTLEQWIYIDFDFIPSSSSGMLLVGQSSLYNSNDYGFVFNQSYFPYNSFIGNILVYSTSIPITATSSINLNSLRGKWNHIVITSSIDNSNQNTNGILSSSYPIIGNTNNQLNLYVNGGLVLSLNNSNWTNWSNPGLSTNNFTIGCNSNNGYIQPESLNKVHFGNTRMYNRILLQDEILNNYNIELPLYQTPTSDIYFIKNPNTISSNEITNYDVTNGWLSQSVDLNELRITNWTIECWSYATSWGSNNDSGWIVDLSSSSTYLAFGVTSDISNITPSISYDGNGRPFIYYSGDSIGQWKIKSSQIVQLNQWNHIAWQKNNETTLEMFVNGLSTGTFTVNAGEWKYPNFVASYGLNNIIIGASSINLTSTTNHWKGKLSQVKITVGSKYSGSFTPNFDLSINDNGLFLLQDNYFNNSIGKVMNNNNSVVIPTYSPPTITLNGTTNSQLFWQINNYTELGYSYNYYKRSQLLKLSVTGTVNTTLINNYRIVYGIMDSVNNISYAKRLVNVIKYNIPPIITLNGQSIIYLLYNSSYIEYGVSITNNLNQTIIPVITGSVNTSQYGVYFLNYSATDSYNNTASVTRTVYIVSKIPIISYDITNGYLGPLTSSNINNIDWTIECWVYLTAYSTDDISCIFDFRFINPYYATHTMIPYIFNNGTLGIWALDGSNFSATSRSSNTVSLNKWTHIAWMCQNSNIYSFINGVATLIATNPSWLNQLYSLNSITLGTDNYWISNNNTLRSKLFGQICQPLVLFGAKYSTTGFTPSWNLRPSNFTNALFWLDNGLDLNSYQSITLQQTVVQKTLTNPPISPVITIIGNNPYYQLKNTTFNDPGATAINYLTNVSESCSISGTVDTSTLGTYTITYSVTDIYGTSSATRTVFVVNSLQVSYNLNNGYLGPLQSSVSGVDYTTLWTVDTTFEAWINVTQYPIGDNGNGGMIIDFRNPNYTSVGVINNNSSCIGISTTGNLYVWSFGGTNQSIITNNIIPLNKWTHIVVMRSNNNFYTFINGVISSPLSASGFSNLSNNTALSLGLCNDNKFYTGNPFTYWKFYGSINQASVQLGAKYSIANFTPSYNLQPNTFTSNNKFFLGPNGNDLISGQIMTNTSVTIDNIVLGSGTPIPTITLNGSNPINLQVYSTYTEPGVTATNVFGDIIIVITTGNVNINQLGTYIITYTASNIYGTTTVTRTININLTSGSLIPTISLNGPNPYNILLNNNYNEFGAVGLDLFNNRITTINSQITYDVTNGWLGPLINNYNSLNSVDWTIEAWIYSTCKNDNNAYVLFDFRSYPYVRNNSFCCAFYPDLTLTIWNDYNNNWYGRSTLKITNNVWNHIVWMRKNQTLYIFINGVVNILGSNDPWMTNLTGCNSLTISADNVMTTQYGSTNTRDKYTGQICQPLITLGAKYNILGFTPQWDLTPSSFSQNNILFWINNGKDVISNQNITLNNTVIQNTLYYSPIGSPVYTVTGTVNNSIIGQNILSYSVTDAYGKSNSITRLVNIVNSLSQISYNTNNGWFGPLVNNYNSLNSVDWTIEAWIYSICISSGNDAYVLFDFRSYPYVRNNAFCCLFYTDNSVGLWNDYNNNWYGKSTIKFSNNMWNHIVWMRKDQTLYIFVNGVVNILGSNDPWINNLTGCNSLTLSTDNYWMSQNGSTTTRNKFLGQICQPLITLGAKYNIIGFTPTWDLTPSIYSNVLFWIQNSIDCITNKTLPIVNTIVQNTLTISPIIPILNLNGNSSYSILINSTYIDPGCTAKDYITGTILTVNIISIKDSSLNELLSAPLISTNLLIISNSIINTSTLTNYIITYSTSNSYGTNTITRTVNIVNSINNTVINYDMNNGWFNTIYNNNLNYINYANNWTIETWINPSNLNNSVGGYGILFDFRNGNTISSSNNGKIGTIISINNSGAILLTTNDVNLNQFVQTLTSNLYLPNNKWSHMTIINNNNNLYTFINGILDSVKITPTSLANNPSITLCVNVDYLPNPPMTNYKFRGLISQPLITSNVKYNLNGFYPQWNLQPSNYNNVLFWLNNGIDVISGQNIVFNGTIIQSTITNPYLPNITLNGNNPFYILLNSTYTDLNSSAKDILGNTLSVISSGTVNTSRLGQNIITYSTIDSNNNFNSIIRTVNVVNTLPQISYNLNNGYLGPLQSSVSGVDYTTLWTVDTTFEAWINVTQYPIYNNGNFNGVAEGVIIDFRNTNLNNNGINNNSSCIGISTTGYLYSWQSNLNYIITNNQILLNQWTHIVFMRFNNKFYTFINGVVSSPLSFSGYTNLSNNTSISLGLTADYIQNNSSALTYYKFYGSINQASVQLGAKYSISNFTPSANLQPQSFTSNNKFFLGSNGIDLISGKAMSNTNVVSSIILPTITLNGPNNLYVYLNNTYNELGAIATDSFGNTLTYTITGTVNNSIVGTYILTYTASNTNGITSINRNIFIINITNTNIIVPSISYIQNALDLSNCYIYCPTTLTSVSSFTYEVYLYLTSYSNNICLLDTKPIGTAAQQTGRFSILITTTGSISIYTAATNTQILLSNNTVPLNIWTHVTIVWTGTILYSLINGVYGGISSSFSGTIGNFQNYMIGAFASDAVGSPSKFNGLISQPLFRTSIVYTTTNFTPTLDLTPLLTDTSVKFFLGSSLVETVSSQTMTVVGTIVNKIRECYPYISNAFDLTNGFIYENHNKNLSLGQFTYECWVYIKSISSFVLLLDTNPISGQINGRLICAINSTGQLYIYNYANNTSTVITLTTASVPLNQWTHVAFVYTGASAYGFINGNYSSTLLTPNYYFYGVNYWDIGFDSNYGNLANALTGNGRLKGFISQPLLRNNIYYKPQNFTPLIDLTPLSTDISILFYFGSNLIDTVTNNTMTTYGTVTNINKPIIFNQINNSFLPNIVLNGTSIINVIINQQYTELGVKISDIFNNNLSYTISGNVDTTTSGVYTLTYSVTNSYGTSSVTRTINVVDNIPIISYDTTKGWLGPLINNYNSMSGVDWTIECWVCPTTVPAGDGLVLFDFSGYPTSRTLNVNSSFSCILYPDYTMSIFDVYNWAWYGRSTIKLTQNKWNHISWMRSNNSLYISINGVINNLGSNITFLNNLSGMNSVVINASNYYTSSNGSTTQTERFLGQISQPLITLGAKYSINGFTPQWNLRPTIFTNVLLWLDNSIDAITGQTIQIQNTVLQNTLTNSPVAPTIYLNGSNQLYILQNTPYLELGALAYDFLGNSLLLTITGSVNISQIGSNTLTYSATQNGLTTNITRTINIINTINSITSNSNITYDTTNGWLGPIKNNYNVMNGVNWTIECWVYCTSYSTNYSTIFDTRIPGINNTDLWFGQFVVDFNSSGYLLLWNQNDSYTSNMTQQKVPLNTWTHLVWMRYNNYLYGFINGISGTPVTITSGYNTINASNNISLGCVVNDHNSGWQFKGKICQPLITLGAKYDINGFIPQWNLQPLNYSNVLLWLQNGVDVISGNTLTLNNTILQDTINSIPFTTGTISLIGNSNYNILISGIYIEPGAISKSFNNISLPVYITSIKNINNTTIELLSSFILVDGKYTVIPNNIINTTNTTTYTIIYTSVDPSNGLILNTTRTVNIVNNVLPISYDVTAGYLGPISKNNLNNYDWTIECWIYQTSKGTNPIISIFDFRDTNPYTASNNFFTYINNTTQCIGIWKSDVGGYYSTSTESSISVSFNTWSHLVWMRHNNNIYAFINGKCSLIEITPTWINNLINLNSITIGIDVGYQYYNNQGLGFQNEKFHGQICQPLISLGAKYSINGFTPIWDLTPITYSNVLFWLQNNIDVISGNTITLDYTVNQIYENTCPIIPVINIIGSINKYVSVNTIYTDLGVTVNYILNPNIIPYITSITDNNGNQYITTQLNALTSNIISNINTSILGTVYTITYSVIYNKNLIATSIRNVTIVNIPIEDIFLWLDPSDSSTIVTSSGNLISINDKSINKVSMIPYYGSTPILANGINNLSVININNTGLISSNTYQNSYNYTLAIVITIYQTNDWGLIFGHYPAGSWDSALEFRMKSGTNNVEVSSDSITTLTTLNGVPVLFLITRTNYLCTLTMINLNNGTSIAVSQINPKSISLGNYNFFIGKFTNSASYNGCYNVGEIMYWERVLSTHEINNVKSFLFIKWSSYTNITPTLILNGYLNSYVYLGAIYTDPGVILNYIINPNLIPYITSITDTNGNNYIRLPLNAYNNNIISLLDTSVLNKVYTITYTLNYSNMTLTIQRFVKVVNIPFSDIFFWIDPSDSSTIITNNNIINIKDKSVNNILMIPYTINNNIASINNSIYSLPVIDLSNGSGLISTTVYNFPTNSILTIAGIVIFTPNVNNNGTILGHYNTSGNYPLNFRYETNSNVDLLTSYQDPGTCLLPINNNVPYMFIGSFSNGVKNLTLISLVDNTTQTITQTAPVSVNQSNGNIFIGVSDSNEKLNSYIGEEMYWQRLLSTTEQNNVMSYLYLKWSTYRNITPVIIINQLIPNYTLINNTYTDPGAYVQYILNPNLIPYITSITDTNNNQYIITPLNALNSNLISNLNMSIPTTYTLTYTLVFNNITYTQNRSINIISPQLIVSFKPENIIADSNNISYSTTTLNSKIIPTISSNGNIFAINPSLLNMFDISQNWSIILRCQNINLDVISFRFNNYWTGTSTVGVHPTIPNTTYRRFSISFDTGNLTGGGTITGYTGSYNVTYPSSYNGSYYAFPSNLVTNFQNQIANGYYVIIKYTSSTYNINFNFYDLNSNLLFSFNSTTQLYNYTNIDILDTNNGNGLLYGGFVLNLFNTNISINDWLNANFT